MTEPKRTRCPFCGDTLTEVIGNEWEENLRVKCIGCLAQSGRYRTRAEAVKAWNTRGDPAAPDAAQKAAEEIVSKNLAPFTVSKIAGIISKHFPATPDAVRQARRETWDAAIGCVKNLWTTTRGNEFNGALNQAVSAIEAAAVRAEGKGNDV